MSTYMDPRAAERMKYLALVAPAPPVRRVDGGTQSNGITYTPSGQTTPGILTIDFPRWVLAYKSALLRVKGTLSSTSAIGARGTIVAEKGIYDFLQNIQMTLNGQDTWINVSGSNLHFFNLIQNGYRNTEAHGQDVVPTVTPYAANPVAFDISLEIPFTLRRLYPRLFCLLNGYEPHGVTNLQCRVNFGSVLNFVTGDANATLAITSVEMSYDVLDFTELDGYNELYMAETAFSRLELRTYYNIAVAAGGVQQRQKLDRGLYFDSLMLTEVTAGNVQGAGGNLTQVVLKRDNYDPYFASMKFQHIATTNCDRMDTNIFANGRTFLDYIELAEDMESSQLINSDGFTDWDLFIDSTAAGGYDLLEVQVNIPKQIIKPKQGNLTMNRRRY